MIGGNAAGGASELIGQLIFCVFFLTWVRRGERQANENVGDLPEIGGVQI